MVGRKDTNMKKMIECWMDRKIYEKQKDGWMDKKNVWIERKMDGWIKQIDGWLEGKKYI